MPKAPLESDAFTVRESDWSFLPPEIPKGVAPNSTPYVRFIAESLAHRDRDLIGEELSRIDKMPAAEIMRLYAEQRAAYDPPQHRN
jgi:hypothetical protein